ncbi:MAG: BrnT family toxin [Proteobacteria bacterium]|nr:BrnT family toxin [Pseudomonadota bacterium]
MAMLFAWDEVKNKSNRKKHGVWFEEAQFRDDSGSEERYILVGVSGRSGTLVVVHCYQESNDVVRIISARKATKRERGFYEKGL